MSDLKPAMHGRDHCPGGSDPIPCLQAGITLSQYDYADTGDNLVADDSWEDVAQPDERWWLEGQKTEGGIFGYNLDSGNITSPMFGLFSVFGSVGYPGITGGEVIGAALIFNTDSDHIYTNAFEVPASAGTPFFKITVAHTWWGTLDDVRLQVYQKSGGTLELGLVTLTVLYSAPMVLGDSNFFEHA
jgi:hypothetical protein